MKNSILATSLKLRYPVVLGPFGNGASSLALTMAVSREGGLGSYGANHLAPMEISNLVKELKANLKCTGGGGLPFNVNLWVPQPSDLNAVESLKKRRDNNPSGSSGKFEVYRDHLKDAYSKFGMDPPFLPPPPGKSIAHDFMEQAHSLIEAAPPVISFTMGIPPHSIILAAKEKSIYLIGTATTVEEGLLLEEAGFDAVVAAGADGGGHRSSWKKSVEDSLVGTFSLIPTMADALRIPVIAAGGISDSRGVRAAMILGADAVQVGSAFVVAEESASAKAYKDAFLDPARAHSTVLTKTFSGRLARGQSNAFITSMKNYEKEEGGIPDYPIQNYLTRPLRQAAAKANDLEYISLWSGQAASLVQRGTAKEILERLAS